MAGAPVTPSEALGAGAAAGLSEAQVTDWAHYYAQREWTTNVGGAIVPMNKRKALASLGSWAAKERHFQQERKLRAGPVGTSGAGDVTIPGVRVSNKGDGLDVDF